MEDLFILLPIGEGQTGVTWYDDCSQNRQAWGHHHHTHLRTDTQVQPKKEDSVLMCVRLPFNEAKFEFQTIGERTFLESEYSLAGSYSAPKSCMSFVLV